MPANDVLPAGDVLVLAFRHEIRPLAAGPAFDPVWDAVTQAFDVHRTRSYGRGAVAFLPALRAHKLFQESRDRLFLLHPEASGTLGRFATAMAGDRQVVIFQSFLRLNTDGPAMPVLDLMKQVVDEVQPRLVLVVGLGGGVLPAQHAGDVLVSNRAIFRLPGELESSPLNGTTVGGRWAPTASMLEGLPVFEELREPRLEPPSPNYDTSGGAVQPAAYVPRASLGELPLMTAPLVTRHGFAVGAPVASGADALGTRCCATDMDFGAVASACGDEIACGGVTGLAVPAIHVFEVDSERALRNGWISFFTRRYAAAAAGNAARVARHLTLAA